jgi:arsenite methyltransferase
MANENFTGAGPAAARRELARRRRALGGRGQGQVPPRGPRGGRGASLRGRQGPAAHLGSPGELLDAIPVEALASFAGVGMTSTSPRPSPAKRCSTSARDRVATSSARRCWWASRAASWGWTSQTSSSTRPRGLATVKGSRGSSSSRLSHRGAPLRRRELRRGPLQRRHQPFAARDRPLAEAARVLRPQGGPAIADTVSGRAPKERTRRNVELWAACIAGAIPRSNYLQAIEAQGLQLTDLRDNDHRFISERASTPAAPTRSRASRCSPQRRAEQPLALPARVNPLAQGPSRAPGCRPTIVALPSQDATDASPRPRREPGSITATRRRRIRGNQRRSTHPCMQRGDRRGLSVRDSRPRDRGRRSYSGRRRLPPLRAARALSRRSSYAARQPATRHASPVVEDENPCPRSCSRRKQASVALSCCSSSRVARGNLTPGLPQIPA